MKSPIRELLRTELPRPLIYATGITCGVLAAMVVQILMSRAGMQLAGAWGSLLSGQTLPARAAGVWWLMGGAAFLSSAVIVAALSRLPLPWHRFRLLRWLIGAAVVAALAEAGHIASTLDSSGGIHVALTLAALCAGALVSLFGAYFAVKR